jgi:hypothetical protein
MSATHRLNERVALAAAVAVAAGAIWGSAASLLRIASDADMSVPWSLPVGLDAVGIVAATAIRRHRADRLAWATLIAATGLSTVLQVLAAPDGLVNHLAHAVPPVAVLISFELFLRATDAHPVVGPVDQPAAVQLVEDASPVAAERTPAPKAVRPEAIGPEPITAKAGESAPGAPVDEELVALAEAVAAELAAADQRLNRRSLMDGLKAKGRPVGTARAGALLAHLRSNPPVLVEASS